MVGTPLADWKVQLFNMGMVVKDMGAVVEFLLGCWVEK